MRVWAPYCETVSVRLLNPRPGLGDPQSAAGDNSFARADEFALTKGDDGWHRGEVPGLVHGVDYEFVLNPAAGPGAGDAIPDPLARWLPNGVFGASRVWDPGRFQWHDEGWRGRSIASAGSVYELHIGTFTPEGTLDAAAQRADYLVELGVTHIELMPVSAFDGDRGWGYDGVALHAVHEAYGGPDALCRFVDVCHSKGLAVLLDVVHNHFGPSGNTWGRLGPFVIDTHSTPWGGAVNLDGPGSDTVRSILTESAQGWIRDFHLDGLRLDAVHELIDNRAVSYLEELGVAIAELSAKLDRCVELIAESDRNDPWTITPAESGGLGMTAQWDDDIHHVLHWLLTGETVGYYADYASSEAVERALAHGFWLDGRWSGFRGRTHGRELDFERHDPWRLVVSLQTHDQIGNRSGGERLSQLTDLDRLAAGAALLLTSPFTPMLFMGEEWGASTPWQFFSSFTDAELGAAVTKGRRQEFRHHGWAAVLVPDPQSPDTFAASRLNWEEAAEPPHDTLLDWYRGLLSLRKHEPGLSSAAAEPGATSAGNARYILNSDAEGVPQTVVMIRPEWHTIVNLTDSVAELPLGPSASEVVLTWPHRKSVQLLDGTARLAPGASAVIRRDTTNI